MNHFLKETTTIAGQVIENFAKEVDQGLSAIQKYIPSKYFYDAEGDRLFEAIMDLPEYYLTRCEYEIFETYSSEISALVDPRRKGFNLIELGAGNGYKTKLLVKAFVEDNQQFHYLPVDISDNILETLQRNFNREFPQLTISPVHADYFNSLSQLRNRGKSQSLYLFLGSNIGNLSINKTVQFLKMIAGNCKPGDQLLTGIDLKKDPSVILSAYNDSRGVTRDFNLNLLLRINRELGGIFDIGKFQHTPTYDPETGMAKSFLMSLEDQDVFISFLDKSFHFRKWETIHTEVSKKYDLEDINMLAQQSGFRVRRLFYDKKHYFTSALFELPCSV